MQISVITTALGLGVAYCAAPGAVNTEAIRRGVACGARSAFLIQLGSLIGDSFWALLALTGVTFFARFLPVQVTLGIAGGCFLLRMAWLALAEAFTHHQAVADQGASTRGDFMTGAIFGLVNPLGLAFWSGLGSSVVASGETGSQFALFFASFFVGAVLWCLGMSAGMRWGRQWLRPAMFRWINALCGLALGYFGVRVLWITFQEWLERGLLPSFKSTR